MVRRGREKTGAKVSLAIPTNAKLHGPAMLTSVKDRSSDYALAHHGLLCTTDGSREHVRNTLPDKAKGTGLTVDTFILGETH